MEINQTQLEKILLNKGYIREEDIQAAKDKEYPSTLEYLMQEGLLTPDLKGQALAEHFELEYEDLNTNIPNKDLVLSFPKSLAYKYRVILVKNDEERVIFTTDDPEAAKKLPSDLEFLQGKEFQLRYSLKEDIDAMLSLYRAPLEKRLNKILRKGGFTAPSLLKNIFTEALQINASDIHFEPQDDNNVNLRFRIDGILQDVAKFPYKQYESILNKIKIDSQLRIDKHDEPLDGALRFAYKEYTIDLRISIVPTINGEKIVIRVLSSYVKGLTLDTLGLGGDNEASIKDAISQPYGMIIVTGPTGSGKTTTLYSLMRMINKRDINITTIEDPVEYRVKGINQIQVNNEKGITFARGLRSIVRQDPNVILVGEIRDYETADISVNAALTGHLLMTTFHANNAAATIPRIIDMGVEPFLLSSTIEAIVAQRLTRKICENCRYSKDVDLKEIKKYVKDTKGHFKSGKNRLYFGKGCPVCNHTGYSGRTAIFEIIRMTPNLKEALHKKLTTSEIWEVARKDGAKSMFEDGLDKVKNGITTLEELSRVASQTEY